MIMGHLLGDSNLQKLKHGSYSYSYFTVENFFLTCSDRELVVAHEVTAY